MSVDAIKTIPTFAAEEGIPLDKLRKLLRRRSDLVSMLEMIGPLRCITSANLDRFRAAVREAIGALISTGPPPPQ